MLVLISSIPTTVREGFEVQDLPSRSVTLNAEQMSQVFGGCSKRGKRCYIDADCCGNTPINRCCKYIKELGYKRCYC